jgi:hypothetical protein
VVTGHETKGTQLRRFAVRFYDDAEGWQLFPLAPIGRKQ